MSSIQKISYKIKVEKGQIYSFCPCGYSGKLPFCDGTHKQKNTNLKSIKYFANEDKVISICGCGKSKNGIFCDHSQVFCDNT